MPDDILGFLQYLTFSIQGGLATVTEKSLISILFGSAAHIPVLTYSENRRKLVTWGKGISLERKLLGFAWIHCTDMDQNIRDPMSRCTHRTESSNVSKTGGGKKYKESNNFPGASDIFLDSGKKTSYTN